MWSINTRESCSIINQRNEVIVHATTWMDLEMSCEAINGQRSKGQRLPVCDCACRNSLEQALRQKVVLGFQEGGRMESKLVGAWFLLPEIKLPLN